MKGSFIFCSMLFIFICPIAWASRFDHKCVDSLREVISLHQRIQRSILRLKENLSSLTGDVMLALILSLQFLPESTYFIGVRQEINALISGFIKKEYGRQDLSPELLPLMINLTLWESAMQPLKQDFEETSTKLRMPVKRSFNTIKARSDQCLRQLFPDQCIFQPTCIFSKFPLTRYSATHALLYIITAKQMNSCARVFPLHKMEMVLVWLCHNIFFEAEELTKKSEMDLQDKDLFLEQTVLCGLEGYTPFASQEWRYLVEHWEDFSCFIGPDSMVESIFSSLRKRNDSLDKDGCHTHPTSLGIAASAFYIKAILSECQSSF